MNGAILGILGAILLLLAFIMLELKILAREKYHFHILNLAGSLLLGFYAYGIGSIIFIALNIIWAGVAVYEIIKLSL